jgi:hypothetical protein
MQPGANQSLENWTFHPFWGQRARKITMPKLDLLYLINFLGDTEYFCSPFLGKSGESLALSPKITQIPDLVCT